jgi:hypothetical protein
MRRRIVYVAVCLVFLTLSILSSGFSARFLQSDGALFGASSNPDASGWLAGWQYRKEHDVIGATGAGTGYQVGIKTYYGPVLNASNTADASIPNDGYLAENIVYDSNTSMYWWIFEDRSSYPLVIGIAYATSINGTWTVQSTPVISETGHYCMAPCIAQLGSYWYIYYGRADGESYEDADVWVQKSSYVNQSYSTSGITNPVLARGSTGSWDPGRVYESYIYFENGTYYLFYMGQDGGRGQAANVSTVERVGYATSSSPISGFVKFSGNPILPADNWPHGWDAGSDQAADPFVFKYGDTYYVGVSAVSIGHSDTGQIGFYTSKDLATFTHYRGNPVLGDGAPGIWDAQAVARGAVTNFNGTLYFSHTGRGISDWRCGLTTLTFSNPDNQEQVFLNGECRIDFGDIRFTGSDGTTLLNYWMESEIDGYLASFWVQVEGDLSLANQTIYVYYGNSSATTTSNGNNTFLLFDDFNGGLTNWSTISGTWNIANGDLTIEPTLGYNYLVSANSVGTNNIAIRTRMMSEPAGYIQAHPGIAWHANNLTGTNQKNDQVYFRPHQYDSSDWANIQPASYSNGIVTFHDDKFGSYFTWSTWYTIEVRIPSSGNVTLYGNDAYWCDWGNQQYSDDHIGFVAHNSGQDYWDYILVRKHVNPEPSHGNWGSEEKNTNHWQMTFDFHDMDSNNMTSRVTWQLYKGTQLLDYQEGEYTLLDDTYTLKTMIDSYIIDVRNLDTTTYGNSTVNVTLQLKQHHATSDGYIALNGTISSLTMQSKTATNLTFTLSGSPSKLLVKVPHNAEYIKKDGLYAQTWTWDYPQKVILLDSANATYEFNFLNVILPNNVPDKPFNPQPLNGSTGTPLPLTLSVNVTDPDGDLMNISFYQTELRTPDNFSIIVLPDTQFYSANINGVGAEIFDNQTRWIVNNLNNMSITFVTHVGDIVDDYTSLVQWQNANFSMSRLDGAVPWAVLSGNHDGLNVGDLNENVTNYNTYFNYSRFSDRIWYGGAYQNNNTNNYELFSGGKDDYLIFHFEYHANDDVLVWANSTITKYPNRRVIVTTHDYLNTDANRTATGERLWQNFVKPHADQIFLVLCGHNHGEAKRSDVANGHTVYQIMADYQENTNGGNGLLRILEFHPIEDKIYVKTYSPYLNSYEIDADSQFVLDYNMTGSEAAQPSLIGKVLNVPSGGVASVPWIGLNYSTTYYWYAVADDSHGGTNQSDTWNFTTVKP